MIHTSTSMSLTATKCYYNVKNVLHMNRLGFDLGTRFHNTLY